ncbi:MAG: tributyrin esterase [Candidatus Bathyarchaeota archaeon]|nr:MAG: tributyrin esterase [Candidatus Bathyarchaeota archaeon]
MRLDEITIDSKGLSLGAVNSQIRAATNHGVRVNVVNVEHLYGIAPGLQESELTVKGNANDYIAFLNNGARIIIEGNTGSFVGDSSQDGEIIVKGNAGYGAGVYSCGGTIVIYGDADDAVGQMLKGGILIVKGNVGDVVGLYMVGGEIVIAGDAGKELGDYMIRGIIYLKGECKSLGHNAKYDKLIGEDLNRLSSLLKKYGIEAKADEFKKIVRVSERPFV